MNLRAYKNERVIDPIRTGRNIRASRLAKQLTVTELATRIRRSKQFVSMVESGERTPNGKMLRAFESVLNGKPSDGANNP